MIRVIAGILVMAAATAHLVACSGGDGAPDPEPAVQESHDAHASHDVTATAPPDGDRWPTDEALRTGMSRIDAAVERTRAMTQPVTGEQAKDLARAVEENVSYIIENCRLPPEPDAALHVLIGRMMAAVGQLKSDAPADAAVTELVRVLQDYRGAFDHAPTSPGLP
jgi:hypothetical protein